MEDIFNVKIHDEIKSIVTLGVLREIFNSLKRNSWVKENR